MSAPGTATAYFAAGCFWGLEHELQNVAGVIDAVSGYQGGHTERPSYESVCSGDTGHAETVRVTFDPARVSYAQLLGWFYDRYGARGTSSARDERKSQYRSAVFADDAQLSEARAYVADRFGTREIGTEVANGGPFYEAEEHHQNYYVKHRPR